MEGPRLGAVAVAAASLGKERETAPRALLLPVRVVQQSDYLNNTLIGSIQYELQQRSATRALRQFHRSGQGTRRQEDALAKLRPAVPISWRPSPIPRRSRRLQDWIMNTAVRTSELARRGRLPGLGRGPR